jgi:hypothetical protein
MFKLVCFALAQQHYCQKNGAMQEKLVRRTINILSGHKIFKFFAHLPP